MATNRRIERINKTLMKEIGEKIMQDVKDPRLTSMISVLDVSMSNDMKNVTVTVSIFGNNELENLKSLEAINSAAGYISSVVSKELRLRWAPTIHFERSNAIAEGVSMYFKLKELTKDDAVTESDESSSSQK